MRSRYLGPLLALLMLAAAIGAFGLNISIAQIDTSGLLLRQRVGAYVSVTDDQGEPVAGMTQGSFGVFESPDGLKFTNVPQILGFEQNAGASEGIAFLLLIDNSGSMYDSLDGSKTTDPVRMRITHAKDAVRSFLASMTNPSDRVGLVAFNTRYLLLSRPSADKERVAGVLDQIRKPAAEEAYTELYAGIKAASGEFAESGAQGDHRPV